jgi:hypothetical protein
MLGATKILTVPIQKQGSTLEKFYGYHKTDTVYYPCTQILGREDVLANLPHHNIFYKIIS